MADDWGPWIEHDGAPCPCPGHWVHVVGEILPGVFREKEGRATANGEGWDWRNYGLPSSAFPGKKAGRIIRYRIRKPRGMALLEKAVADVREPVEA